MSDWQVGDLAVCVNSGPSRFGPEKRHNLVVDKVYRVVGIGGGTSDGRAPYSLFVAGAKAMYESDGYGFDPDRFRKIRPDEHEACEHEFVTLLKRTKRTVRA